MTSSMFSILCTAAMLFSFALSSLAAVLVKRRAWGHAAGIVIGFCVLCFQFATSIDDLPLSNRRLTLLWILSLVAWTAASILPLRVPRLRRRTSPGTGGLQIPPAVTPLQGHGTGG